MPIPLVERSEREIAQAIKRKVEAVKRVRDCHELRLRMTGKRYDVSMHVALDSNLTLEETHKIALDIEKEVKTIVPNARVTINTEPSDWNRASIWKLAKDIAEVVPGSRGAHNIHVQEIDGKLCVDLHLEVSADMTVKMAHDISDQIEQKMHEANPEISDITVHMESASDVVSRELTGVETELESYIEHIAERFPEIRSVYGTKVRKIGRNLHVVVHCNFDPDLSLNKAHQVSNELEKAIINAYPNIERVDIHEEPL